MDLTQVTQLVLNGQISDSYEDVLVDVVIVRVHFKCGLTGNFTQHWEHDSWLLSEPDGQRRLLVGQMREVDLNALSVVLAHLVDPVLIDVAFLLVGKVTQEAGKLAPDELVHLSPRNPCTDWSLCFRVIVYITETIWIVRIITGVATAEFGVLLVPAIHHAELTQVPLHFVL